MNGKTVLKGPSLAPRNGQAKQIVILLHGYGANGDDLLELGHHWSLSLPDAEFLAPHAPFPCEMTALGYQWFSLERWHPDFLLEQIQLSVPQLNEFIDENLTKRGLTDDNLVIVGFSQGAMMALHIALTRSRPCAGVIGYSGALIYEGTATQGTKTPILLIHGDVDEVVPYASMDHAEERLISMGVPVQTYTCSAFGHGINQNGIEVGEKFLRKHLLKE